MHSDSVISSFFTGILTGRETSLSATHSSLIKLMVPESG